ncbi:MAG: hypothetical protein AVDCRST_MAG23-594 [uncultured Sphingosinicella sp.]|uniref:Uncharacterized protein n=1 Tax=uncultured Sphingosinicella sp. TaxID=478748 RepID=A0A6J4TLA1_9SPHN|nr:hypothetical protein [uncultured Sphingosinicella sp.]CAA9526406.1 MAG: hypothetical protein AVDCRST_MAG23-594 [uncultured Sphingosinicella sp.]
MKKVAIFAAVGGLTLIAAAPHDSAGGYPPCSATVTDSCIQLYERGVATQTNLALNDQLGPNRAGIGLAAMGGPYEPIEPDQEYAAYEADEYASDWTADEPQAVEDDWTSDEESLAYTAPEEDAYSSDGYADDMSGVY